MKFILYFITVLLLQSCAQPENKKTAFTKPFQTYTVEQKNIIEEYSDNCALKYNYTFQMQEYQECLDNGIKADSTISSLWQQKAMPYFKARKYEAGMEYIDKAVHYNPQKYLPYRAFIKCIFAKTYKEAIIDFENAIKMHGNTYEMDHTYKFHIALSYLQLNKFEEAEILFKEDIDEQNTNIDDGAHYLDLFYYGITKFEIGKWEEAIEQFDQALKTYPTFAEVLFYKGLCLAKLENKEEAQSYIAKAYKEGKEGNTINEDNVIYEMYPYQIKWNH